jgi:hypothetical protein
MPKLRSLYQIANYESTRETLSAPGALNQKKCNHYLAVDGTDAFTLSAPKFKGQKHRISQLSGANSPVGSLTVTGMKIATQNVFSGFDRTTAQLDAAPRYLELVSEDGATWTIVSMIGVTVA